MKAKVLKPFTDKVNGKTYKKNEVIEVTAARFNEIISSLELAIGPVLSIWHNQLSRRLKVLGTGISSYHELREGRIYEGVGIVTSYT